MKKLAHKLFGWSTDDSSDRPASSTQVETEFQFFGVVDPREKDNCFMNTFMNYSAPHLNEKYEWMDDDHPIDVLRGLTVKRMEKLFFTNDHAKEYFAKIRTQIDYDDESANHLQIHRRSLLMWEKEFIERKVPTEFYWSSKYQHFLHDQLKEEWKISELNSLFREMNDRVATKLRYENSSIAITDYNSIVFSGNTLSGKEYVSKVACIIVPLIDFDWIFNYLSLLLKNERINEMPIYLVFSQRRKLERNIKNGSKLSEKFPDYKGDDANVESVLQYCIQKCLTCDVSKKIVKHFVIPFEDVKSQIDIVCEILRIYQPKLKTERPVVSSKKKFIKGGFRNLMTERVIYNIFKFISREELLHSYSKVCKMWMSVYFNTPISLTRPNLDLIVEKSSFQNITSLNLQSCFLQSHHLRMLTEHSRFKKLNYLNVSNNYLPSFEDWSNLFKKHLFRKLKTLIMEYCNLESIGFLLEIHTMNRLETLSLIGNTINDSERKRLLKSHIVNNLQSELKIDME